MSKDRQGGGGAASRGAPEPDWPLHERPGFLIRRAHQIHGSLFAELCGDFRVTPLQFSLLSALAGRDGVDLTSLANLVALDRTTATGALKRLEARGLVLRAPARGDRRAQDCRLTAEGASLLQAIEGPARRAHEATVDGLSVEERGILMGLLRRIVDAREGRRGGPEVG